MTLPQCFNKQEQLIARQNISVVDTVANQLIGTPLKVWDDFLSSDPDVPDDERMYTSNQPQNSFPYPSPPVLKAPPRHHPGDFSVTIPDDLPADCGQGGNCVLQWYWYATGNEQTYISCLDFTI
jgi:hypothetical protein